MHLQASVEGFDVFARSLSIGAETMVMDFRPDQPMHDRYAVSHDFLSPETGDEVLTISRLINAFFRWEFNSCETLVADRGAPDRLRERVPGRRADLAALLLPVGDPHAAEVGVYCSVTGRPMRIVTGPGPLLRVGDRGPVLRGQAGRVPPPRRRLLRGRGLRRVHDETSRTSTTSSCSTSVAGVRPPAGRDRPRACPEHEQEQFAAHYRGLLGLWVTERGRSAPDRLDRRSKAVVTAGRFPRRAGRP